MNWKAPLYFLLCFLPCAVWCQEKIQTIVPRHAIQVGEAFQVQYVSFDKVSMIQSPDFGNDFQLVSGPRFYLGSTVINNTKTEVRNFSYTLVPLRKGRLVVKGATFVNDNKKTRCADAVVLVQFNPDDEPAISALPAGQEVFIEAVTSKKECFIGEPVVATFTLFSRLSSAAEIIKNPGFYGFSVVDMPGALEKAQSVESRGGNFYNTHILRKVQLYPAQSGTLVIDEMRVNSAVELMNPLTGVFTTSEKLVSSKPLSVRVKPLPQQAKNLSGAVGDFSIYAYLITNELESGKTGRLVITLNGQGNFLQIDAPEIQWPAGVEVFTGPITENLNAEMLPVEGSRRYEYNFMADSAGRFAIPPVLFTYFHPADKKYKTVTTDTLHFTVSRAGTESGAEIAEQFGRPKNYVLPAITLAVLAGMGMFLLQRKRKRTAAAVDPVPSYADRVRSVPGGGYLQLQQVLYEFIKKQCGLSHLSRPDMDRHAKACLANPDGFLEIWEECERVQYYNAQPEIDFEILRQQALAVVGLLGDRGETSADTKPEGGR